jgi:hypothetical protein
MKTLSEIVLRFHWQAVSGAGFSKAIIVPERPQRDEEECRR